MVKGVPRPLPVKGMWMASVQILGRQYRRRRLANIMTEQLLFGGAFSLELPVNRNDMSVVRQIPDNQEVFAHPQTDQSLIIELMEEVETQQPDEHAIKTHFEDLATVNGSASSNIIQTEEITPNEISLHEAGSCWYILGEQSIAKFKETAKNLVQIHMGLIRVPKYSTDVLITLNDPINISTESSSHHAVPTSAVRWNSGDFKRALQSIKLLDPGVFEKIRKEHRGELGNTIVVYASPILLRGIGPGGTPSGYSSACIGSDARGMGVTSHG
ncbi:MOG1-like protein [Mya arenaria]|uniref:MOG1-like protein n=1 Tax=Mya arenaria TaxID=6604 RepID=A0ABY7F3T9_MYAAR|nr:MOG1-like protein [Mya arenaria]